VQTFSGRGLERYKYKSIKGEVKMGVGII